MDSKRIASLFVIFVALFTFGLIGYLTYDSLEDSASSTYLKFKDEQSAAESLADQTIENEFMILSGHVLRSTALDETFIISPENGNRLSIYIKNDVSDASSVHVHIYKNGQKIHTDELTINEIGVYTRKIQTNATYKIQFDSNEENIPFSTYLEVRQYHIADDIENEEIIADDAETDIIA